MKVKHTFLLIFLIVAGFVVGGAIAQVTQGIGMLSWLSHSATIGIDAGKPAYIDLAFIQLALGFQMKLNVAEVVFMIAAVIVGRKLR
ncbi:MAG: DUF4321 domain-containing protein [Clostridia bacterium]|nr:DUF4321 domain-containing protein [Clostridia bacterium]MDR3645527.1 DUF4321 domain-containing protein [Clostridia bacterium]